MQTITPIHNKNILTPAILTPEFSDKYTINTKTNDQGANATIK